jgi:hypothetical protein
LIEIIIPSSVEILGGWCFSECRLLSSVTFESGSKLSRIEQQAFNQTGLIEIILPSSVEILGARCFSECVSLSSVTFERGSRLREVGQDAFFGLSVTPTLPTKEYCLK